ncbi:MAG: HEAT repeat domain-containing protein [Planctomycetota bacterium]
MVLIPLACAALVQGASAQSTASPARVDFEEARQAIAAMRAPDGFRIEVFAAEPLLVNPVAFCFDAMGRAFVAETFRHSQGVTDIRSHMDWLEDDLAIRTVADRVEMFRKHEGEEGLREGYAVETERVRRIVDVDGDGVADTGTVFAEGFDDPAAGIAAGLLARPAEGGGTELWYTCIPDLWRLIDRDDDGVADERVRHSTGYGLRVALLGHDLHGLAIGPDGRLYFSIGDRGFNVTTDEGEELVRYGTGAVFRCELDGRDLEIFCDGLRNPQELVFDELGELFTLDNNSDAGDQARWTWLLEGSDTGWRQAYQWVESPVARGPWRSERLWEPYHEGQPFYVLPPIANLTSGPSGLVAYPGTGWGESWNGTFFVCDFRGNPGYSGIVAFRHEPSGAGYALSSKEEFVWGALPTDVDFGPGGDLYFTDWVTGWNRTGKGRIFRVTPDDRPLREAVAAREVDRLLAAGFGGFTDEVLVDLFEHRDQRVRQAARLALAARVLGEENPRAGYDRLLPALKVLREPDVDRRTARLHSLWCAWQVVRSSPVLGQDVPKFFIGLLFDPDPEIVAQAARVLGDVEWAPAGRRLAPLLLHESPRVRLRAAEALGAVGHPEHAVGPLLEVLQSDSSDPWFRTASIRALERLGNRAAIHEALGHPDPHVRKSLVVVLRRWGDGVVAAMLDDASADVRAEAARAIYDVPIADAIGDLAAFLERAPEDTDDVTWRRAIHANREAATAEAAGRLIAFAASERASDALRAEALSVLADWGAPRTRDGIVRDHRPIPAADPVHLAAFEGDRLEVVLPSPDALRRSEALALSTVAALRASMASRMTPPPFAVRSLDDLASDEGIDVSARRDAYEVLLELAGEHPITRERTLFESERPGSPLRAVALRELRGDAAVDVILAEARDGGRAARAEALRVLASLQGESAAEAFVAEGSRLADGDALLVEWLEAAAASGRDPLERAAEEREAAWAESEDPLARWRMCLQGGDVERGREVFVAKSETSCTKCHAYAGAGGSEAGPGLDDVGARLTRDAILRSIVLPNAEISEGYETWLLMTDDGETFVGRILEETPELLVLEDREKEQYEFTPDEISARRRDVSAMPADVSSHLSRREMRDLVAFLASLGR